MMKRNTSHAMRLTRRLLVLACAMIVGLAALRPADAAPGSVPVPTRGAAEAPTGRVAMGEIFFMQRHPATKRMEWIGSLIIWSLIGLSAVSLGLMGSRLWENRREVILPEALARRAGTMLRTGRTAEFADFLRVDDSDLGRLLTVGLAARDTGAEAMMEALEAESDLTLGRRLRRIEPLNIIGNVAPMIGLFGTVYGMILVFRAIVAAGGSPDPTNLAAGIGTKLVGTFWGLVVAIPALSAYALLRNRIEGASEEALATAKRALKREPTAEERPA